MDHYLKTFLTGQSITLQQMAPADLESFVAIESETKTLLLANDEIPFPQTMEDHSAFFHSISGKKDEFFFGIYEKATHQLIGSCGVFAVNWQIALALWAFQLDSNGKERAMARML